MLLKLPIMLSSKAPKAMLQKSPYYAPIMFRAVPLCPKHASTILQLNTQLEYINECSIKVFIL